MNLPEPKRADISIEEAITTLAWGVPFTQNDFSCAFKFGKHREDIPRLEKRIEELNVERAKNEAAYSLFKSEYDQAHPMPNAPEDEGDFSADLTYRLAMQSRNADFASAASELYGAIELGKAEMFACAIFIDDVRRADLSAREMESAADGITFGCDAFWRSLEIGSIHLWNAIKASSVVAMGMSDQNALDWQIIPPAWFNHDPQPHCDFGDNAIGRSDGPLGLVPRWYSLRFDRSQIENLRRDLLREVGVIPASDSPAPPTNTIPAMPSLSSPNQERQIMLVLRDIKPKNPEARPTEKECQDALRTVGISIPRATLRNFMSKLGKPAKSGPRPVGS